MRRPLIPAVIFLAGGILFSRILYPGLGLLWLLIGALGAGFLIWAVFKQKIAFVYPVLAVLGFFLLQNSITDRYEFLHDHAASNGHVRFTGIVTDVSTTARGRPRAVVRTSEFYIDGQLRPARVNILVYLDMGDEALVGARATVEGNLNPLRFRRNPGAFDEFTFLRARKIEYTMFPTVYIEEPPGFYPLGIPARASARLQAVIIRLLPPHEAGILIGILLGDRAGIDRDVQDTYRNAGMYHILAVSGLHVSVIAMFLSRFLAKTGVSRRNTAIITLGFLLFYCLMTGANPGTVRASLMYGVHLLGVIIFRRSDGLTSISFAALVLLIYEPLYLWDIGFQFSFAAATGLIAGTPAAHRILGHLSNKVILARVIMDKRFLREHGIPVIVATAISFPIQAFYFFQFPLIGLISNLLVLPTIAVTVAFGFAAALLGLVNIGLGGLVAVVPRLLIQFYDYVIQSLGGLPFATVFTGRPAVWVIFAYFGAFVLVAWAMSLHRDEYRRFKGRLVAQGAFGGCCLAIIIWNAVPAPLTITMLYVGQGESIVISRGGEAFIIDGGGRSLERIGDDQGVRTVLPFLAYLGVERIEAAFVTHSHEDHAIGVIEAIDAGIVNRLYLSYAEMSFVSEVYLHLLSSAERAGTEVVYIGAGYETSFFGSRVKVSCLSPTAADILTMNNASLLLMVEAYGVRFLFTGDMENLAEEAVLAMYYGTGALRADVLNLAHHGSRTSSSWEFLEAVDPVVAMVSSGHNNIFGHPHSLVVGRLSAMDIPLLRTDLMGAVQVFPRDNAIRIQTMAGFADERVKRGVKIW